MSLFPALTPDLELAPPVELAPKSIKFGFLTSNFVIPHNNMNIIPYLAEIIQNGADSISIPALLSFEVIPDLIHKNAESTHHS